MAVGPLTEIRRPALVSLIALLDLALAPILLYFSFATIPSWPALYRFSIASIALTLLVGMLGLLHLVASLGLWKMRRWGRYVQLALSSCWLIGAPLGATAGVIALVYLNAKGMKPLFSGLPADRMDADERNAVIALMKSGRKWFWGFSAAVAGAFVFTVVALSNMIHPADRGRMRRTVYDMKQIAIALDNYKNSTGVYPESGDLQKLHELIWKRPAEGRTVLDGWGRPFRYSAWREKPGSPGPDRYAIGSAGKDGTWEHPRLTDYQELETERYDNDIVLLNGEFIQYPGGTRQ